MNTQRILMASTIGLALSLGACDSGEKAGAKGAAKTADAKGADAKGADAKGADAKGADAKVADAKVADGGEPAADGGEAPADGGEAAADEIDPRVIKASTLAKKIESAPEKTDEILATAGLDRTSFRALMVEVSKGELAEDYRLQMAEEG